MAENDPISQFEIHELVPFEINGFNLAFTNSSFFMVLTIVSVTLLMALATSKRAVVPGRGQSVAELLYGFVADMVRSTTGNEGLRFFPFVFTLFMFILMANMLGMFPYFPAPGGHSFTITSHVIVTATLAVSVMALVIGFGLFKHGFGFLKVFVPSGVPWYILWFVVIIEVFSFFSRPLSLAIRLFANILAGHILLKVFAGFIPALLAAGWFGLISPAPLFMVVALTGLEFLVAFLQAYVFAILTCIYLNDALHPGH